MILPLTPNDVSSASVALLAEVVSALVDDDVVVPDDVLLVVPVVPLDELVDEIEVIPVRTAVC